MCENKTLYLGLELPKKLESASVIHCPIIKIVPCSPDRKEIKDAFGEFSAYTHFVFTSKSAVNIFFQYCPLFGFTEASLEGKQWIAVGQATAGCLLQHGVSPTIVAHEETAEGVISELKSLKLDTCYFFWPHSARSRPVITQFFEQYNLRYRDCIFYKTLTNSSAILPDLNRVDEIIFTSPSTVDAFIEMIGFLPTDKQLTAIGPVTHAHLAQKKEVLKP